jgi:diacylglycerol kinase family enzyme
MPAAAFVINQALGSHHFRSACRASAERAGWKPELLVTATSVAGARAASKAVAAGAGLVVAAGGDGTVRACAQALAGTGVPLGIVSLGTANLLARALGLPRHPAAALRVALTGHSRLIDLAAVSGESEGEGEDMVVTAMAGIGLDAAVVAATRFKRRLGWPAYAIAGAMQVARPAATFSIRIDDAAPIMRKARSVVVANCGQLPGGFTILPDARPGDGLLDVAILAPEGPLGWVRLAELVMRGDGRLERYRARRVEITANSRLPRQADGELLDRSRTLLATVRPGALLVRCDREPPGRSG